MGLSGRPGAGLYLRTTDGWRTWTIGHLPDMSGTPGLAGKKIAGVVVSSISCLSLQVCVAGAYLSFSSTNPLSVGLFTTTDGGAHLVGPGSSQPTGQSALFTRTTRTTSASPAPPDRPVCGRRRFPAGHWFGLGTGPNHPHVGPHDGHQLDGERHLVRPGVARPVPPLLTRASPRPRTLARPGYGRGFPSLTSPTPTLAQALFLASHHPSGKPSTVSQLLIVSRSVESTMRPAHGYRWSATDPWSR